MRAGGEDRRRARGTRASDDDDGGRRILGRGNARARGGSTARRVERAALPHAFETSWWVEQAATCGVILAAYGAMAARRRRGRGRGGGCPRCDGTGRTACSCTRWSDDGEGCGACGYTGLTVCPACRGGGRAVRVTVKIEVPAETDEAEAFERDRSGARWIEDAPAFTSSMNPVVMDSTEPRGREAGREGTTTTRARARMMTFTRSRERRFACCERTIPRC